MTKRGKSVYWSLDYEKIYKGVKKMKYQCEGCISGKVEVYDRGESFRKHCSNCGQTTRWYYV